MGWDFVNNQSIQLLKLTVQRPLGCQNDSPTTFKLCAEQSTIQKGYLNPLHPNIIMHIFHTVLYTFPEVLTWRICLTIKSLFSWRSFLLFS